MKITSAEIHAPILGDRDRLLKDIETHISDNLPHVAKAYPRPYFLWVLNESIDIGLRFQIDDVYSMRTFVSLRWIVAPGFYKQVQINAVLVQAERTAESRFEELTRDEFGNAWLEAEDFDSSLEWRESFWSST